MLRLLCAVALLIVLPAAAQVVMPPPANPVVFCAVQAAPAADNYMLIFDGGAPEALTMDATVNAACPASSTHSFQVPASRFTIGTHTVRARADNAFGQTLGDPYTVQVGIAPGKLDINAVIAP